jgi:hypothetical protein
MDVINSEGDGLVVDGDGVGEVGREMMERWRGKKGGG